ncbi:unnamed protein product [Adineta steineri]|uniref:Uncharacterized protein n=1 Tax=Adineta steineri TaxID=433720 RepID=A0A814JX58_9BILA|nr:unnamed protein product [Adineta steineri]CAF1296926.1 unnamed protein product [Adineta steineri]CAF3519215.1 unnamed protein product [Adineta steineri]CAF3744086.1 unnamed protein product [Adineta steineri]
MMRSFASLLIIVIVLNGILSSPTSCPPYSCIVDSSYCFCGVTQTPDDRCCTMKCTQCGPEFFNQPWLTMNWGSFDFSTLDLSLPGRK